MNDHCPSILAGGIAACGKLGKALTALIIIQIASSVPAFTQGESLSPTIVISVNALSDAQRSTVVRALSGVTTQSSYVVQNGDTVSGIINARYGYYASALYSKTYSAIEGSVKTLNSLSENATLREGQQLSLPNLPRRPFTAVQHPRAVQVMSLDDPEVALHSMGPQTKTTTPHDPEKLKSGVAWVVRGTSPQLNQFLHQLPPETARAEAGNAIYVGYPDLTLPVQEPAVTQIATAPPILLANPNLPNLSLLSDSDSGKYYVIDFFKRVAAGLSCPHGQMVMEVAKQVLESSGAGVLTGDLMPIELDFYGQKSSGEAILRAYTSKFAPDVKAYLDSMVSDLLKNQPAANTLVVPLMYVQAVYDSLLSRGDTGVISSSFWLRADIARFLPTTYTTSSPQILVSAVSSDYRYVEDAVTEEPTRSYFDLRHDYGVLLVGALDAQQQPIGMVSRAGDGVTCLHSGVGWGQQGSCIRPSDAGTSFSTPAISTELFIARAFWKHQTGVLISAKESRSRLMLSSEIIPTEAQLYGSAGIPVLARLLNTTSYVVSTAGVITAVMAPVGFIRGTLDGDQSESLLGFGNAQVRGLQVVGDDVYVFVDGGLRWRKIGLTAISLRITPNDQEIASPSSLKANVHSLTIL